MKIFQKLFYCLIIAISLVACSKSNDPASSLPKIAVSDASAAEGSMLTFTVTLTTASTETVEFSYITQDGTATLADYTQVLVKMTAQIPAGQTSVDIQVAASVDGLAESNETFKLELSDPKNCTIADGEGVGTITNVAANDYFLKCKINGVQWNAIIGGFFGAEILGSDFPSYGTDNDSQLSFIFYQDPTGTKTYGMEEISPSSDANISVLYTPHFFSTGGLGTTWNGQPGGQFVITSFNTTTNVAEGTFSFTGKASDNSTVTVTEGSFKVPIEN